MIMTKQEFEKYIKKYSKGKRGAFVFAELDETGIPHAGVCGGGFEAMICISCIIKNYAKKSNAPVDAVIEAITMMIKDAIKSEEEQNKEEANKIIERMFDDGKK
jgi:hypothetical protein